MFSFMRANLPWLAAGGILTFLSSFGQTFFISIFAAQIQEAFSLSHGAWGGIYTLGTGASALVMIWAGGLTDHYRVRRLGPVILALLCAACLFMALNPAVALLPLVIFALRLTGQGMTGHIAIVAMSRWFNANRGKALSIATLGFSIGESLLPIGFVALMLFFDWRLLWLLAGLITLAGIPALIALLRNERTPKAIAESSSLPGMDNLHWSRWRALSHPLFWLMIPALLGPSAFNTAFFFHQVHFAGVKEVSHLHLVALFPAYTLFSVVWMILSGWALDRLGTKRLLPYYQLPMVAAFVMFSLAESTSGIVIGLLFLAMTTGGNATLPNAFWAEFYGTKHLGAIKALAAAVMVLGSAIGPGITGLGIDLGIGIEMQYLFVAAYFLLCTACMGVGIYLFGRRAPAASRA